MLALVAVFQRAAGTSKLLFLLQSRSGKPPEMVFGPWSYRSNAAQYFNLVWPVCVGFWLWLQAWAAGSSDRRVARFDGPQIVLLPSALLMAAAPTLSGSRAGALVSAGLGVLALLLIVGESRRQFGGWIRWFAILTVALAGVAALVAGGALLRERLVLLRMRLPEVPKREYDLLLTLGRVFPAAGPARNCFHLSMEADGALTAAFLGVPETNACRRTSPGFASRFAGREVTLAVVRGGGIRWYVDGRDLGGNPPGPDPSGDGVVIDAPYLYVYSGSIVEAAVLGVALDDAGVRDASGPRLAEAVDRIRTLPLLTAEGAGLAATLTVPDGVSAGPLAPDGFLAIRRTGGAGILGFRWTGRTPAQSPWGRTRVSLTVRNPSAEPLRLGITVNAGTRGLVELPPGGEEAVEAICRVPGDSGGIRQVDVVAMAPDGVGIGGVPTGAEFSVSGLVLAPEAEACLLELNDRFSLASLRQRMSGRPEILVNARRMAADHPVWGSGAGTFATLYGLYRRPQEQWAAYVHDDWLELQITMGSVGVGLVVLGLAVLFVRSWRGPGIRAPRVVIGLGWAALGGCLVHAWVDFPFQVYSVAFLFVVLAAGMAALTAGAGVRPGLR
jgi:hypothetical protein